jgi:hypothetical protein
MLILPSAAPLQVIFELETDVTGTFEIVSTTGCDVLGVEFTVTVTVYEPARLAL